MTRIEDVMKVFPEMANIVSSARINKARNSLLSQGFSEFRADKWVNTCLERIANDADVYGYRTSKTIFPIDVLADRLSRIGGSEIGVISAFYEDKPAPFSNKMSSLLLEKMAVFAPFAPNGPMKRGTFMEPIIENILYHQRLAENRVSEEPPSTFLFQADEAGTYKAFIKATGGTIDPERLKSLKQHIEGRMSAGFSPDVLEFRFKWANEEKTAVVLSAIHINDIKNSEDTTLSPSYQDQNNWYAHIIRKIIGNDTLPITGCNYILESSTFGTVEIEHDISIERGKELEQYAKEFTQVLTKEGVNQIERVEGIREVPGKSVAEDTDLNTNLMKLSIIKKTIKAAEKQFVEVEKDIFKNDNVKDLMRAGQNGKIEMDKYTTKETLTQAVVLKNVDQIQSIAPELISQHTKNQTVLPKDDTELVTLLANFKAHIETSSDSDAIESFLIKQDSNEVIDAKGISIALLEQRKKSIGSSLLDEHSEKAKQLCSLLDDISRKSVAISVAKKTGSDAHNKQINAITDAIADIDFTESHAQEIEDYLFASKVEAPEKEQPKTMTP